jgi:Enoyl-CoA hydratase/isomerase
VPPIAWLQAQFLPFTSPKRWCSRARTAGTDGNEADPSRRTRAFQFPHCSQRSPEAGEATAGDNNLPHSRSHLCVLHPTRNQRRSGVNGLCLARLATRCMGRLRIISDQAPGAIPRSGFVHGRRADLDTARHHAPMEHSVSTALRGVATILSQALRKAAHTCARRVAASAPATRCPDADDRRRDPTSAHAHLQPQFEFEMMVWLMKKPVIASVQGHVLGGGGELVMLRDLTIAADSATFGEPEIRFSAVGAAIVMPMITGCSISVIRLMRGSHSTWA